MRRSANWGARRPPSTPAPEAEVGSPGPGSPPRARIGAGWRLVGLAVGVALAFGLVAGAGSLSVARVRGWADGYGLAGPLVFVLLSSALTVALVPGPLLAGASGLLFGTALGTPVSIVSATLGAVAAFLIARHVAGDAAEQLGGTRVRDASEWVGRRGFLSVLYARIAPGVPYTLVNYIAGLSPVRLRAFAGATALGVAPRAFAYTALGGSLGHLTSPEALVAVGVLVAMALVAGALALRERARHPDPRL